MKEKRLEEKTIDVSLKDQIIISMLKKIKESGKLNEAILIKLKELNENGELVDKEKLKRALKLELNTDKSENSKA